MLNRFDRCHFLSQHVSMFPNSDCNLQSPWLPVMLAVSSPPPEGCEVLRSAVEVTNGNSSILFAFNIVLIANIIIFNKYIPTANIRWENSCDQCCLHISQVAYKETHTKLHIISCTMWPCVVFWLQFDILCNNNTNNNSHDNVYGAVIMTQSSPSSSDECSLSAGWPPTLRPSQSTWAVSPPKIGSYHPHPPSPLLLLLSP